MISVVLPAIPVFQEIYCHAGIELTGRQGASIAITF
jgi:hypothetical protein